MRLKKYKKEYRDDLLNRSFTYCVYSGTPKQIYKLYSGCSRSLKKKLWHGSNKEWLNKKVELYGIYLSRPSMFSVITPTGLNAPYSYYSINLRS